MESPPESGLFLFIDVSLFFVRACSNLLQTCNGHCGCVFVNCTTVIHKNKLVFTNYTSAIAKNTYVWAYCKAAINKITAAELITSLR